MFYYKELMTLFVPFVSKTMSNLCKFKQQENVFMGTKRSVKIPDLKASFCA